MMGLLFVLILFIICVGGCYWLFTSVFGLFFGTKKETYIDRSVHHHYHKHEHKSISIIDDETKKNVFDLRESKQVD